MIETISRDLWRFKQNKCFNPACNRRGSKCDIMDTHEIIGSSDRHKTVLLPAFWLHVCREHHNELGSRPNQKSLVEQLAWKARMDGQHFDAVAVIKMWRPKATDQFVDEIIAAVNAEFLRLHELYCVRGCHCDEIAF